MTPRPAQPVRTCVACRAVRPKRELVRAVRASDGSIRLDPAGTAQGRGAYVCHEHPLDGRDVQQGLARSLRAAPREQAVP